MEQLSYFLLGAAASAVSMILWMERRKRSPPKTKQTQQQEQERALKPSTTTSSSNSGLVDSPDLDLRLLRKAEAVIRGRTFGLTVVVERCTSDHNYSAILRTVEALGIQNVAIVDPPPQVWKNNNRNNERDDLGAGVDPNDPDESNNDHHPCDKADDIDVDDDHGIDSSSANHQQQQQQQQQKPSNNFRDYKKKVVSLTPFERKQTHLHHLFAQNATEWLTITDYGTTQECIRALKESGHQLWVTDLSQYAVPLLREELQKVLLPVKNDSSPWLLPEKLAIVFGTEAVGCSQQMLQAADLRVYLPMRGFADSLNLSVATALVLHQLFLLQPQYIGLSTEEERLQLRRKWFPKLAKQRLYNKREKKERKRLWSNIHACLEFQAQLSLGNTLTVEQQIKLNKLPDYQNQWNRLEQKFSETSSVMEYWIQNPPEPLGDLRRPDLHRITFVGKSTKQKNSIHWKDMVAISNVSSTVNSTCQFFKQQLTRGKETQYK